jgi:hypothetical protein
VSTHRVREDGDPEFQIIASIAATLRPDYMREGIDDPWSNSPFGWIRPLPPPTKGTIGVQLIAGWCAAKGLDVIRSRDSQADKVIAGLRVEVKFSLRWENGTYLFQQIRDQDFEYAICLGLSPLEAHAWIIPKPILMEHATPQHTGRGGKDTFWIRVDGLSPQPWLHEFGGTLSEAFEVLKRFRSSR